MSLSFAKMPPRSCFPNGTVSCLVALLASLRSVTLSRWYVLHSPIVSVILTAVYQIPNFYTLLDRIDYLLSPNDGLLGVVDFYTSGKPPSLHEKAIGGPSKECNWLSRWQVATPIVTVISAKPRASFFRFWQIWFDFDHVSLSPQRRDYLEYRFGTVRVFTCIHVTTDIALLR